MKDLNWSKVTRSQTTKWNTLQKCGNLLNGIYFSVELLWENWSTVTQSPLNYSYEPMLLAISSALSVTLQVFLPVVTWSSFLMVFFLFGRFQVFTTRLFCSFLPSKCLLIRRSVQGIQFCESRSIKYSLVVSFTHKLFQ